MKYTHVIWDFNGTLFDDVKIGIDAVNVMLSARGMKTINSVDEYKKVFGFPIKEYYRRLGFDFSKEDYETVLAPEWVNEYSKRELQASLCVGVKEALDLFRNIGIKQSVISASDQKLLNEQIERLGIRDYFESVIGCDNFFAYGKGQLCKRFVDVHKRDTFILVGDSTHDYECALEAGIDCALVLSGHMDLDTLSKCGSPIFERDEDLSSHIIDNNNSLE